MPQRYGVRVSRRGPGADLRADADPGLVAAEDDAVAALRDRPAFRRVDRPAVVSTDGRLVGIVSITDLERTLRARRITPPPAQPQSLVRQG
jgi:hypothetical protein